MTGLDARTSWLCDWTRSLCLCTPKFRRGRQLYCREHGRYLRRFARQEGVPQSVVPIRPEDMPAWVHRALW